jgi:hypothetical protein
MAQFYVDFTSASAWGRAPDLAAAGGSSRKHKDGGEGRRLNKAQESELALNPKFERIRNWSTMLQIKDYILPDLFSRKSW